MNRRGFLGSIAAAVVAAKSGFLPKVNTPVPIPLPMPGEDVVIAHAGERIFFGRIVGVALEAAAEPGDKIAVMIEGMCDLTRAGEYSSGRNESGTFGAVAGAPIKPGDFLMTDVDGRVRPANYSSNPTA